MAAAAPTIAYLTVTSEDHTGWTGGLLLLNSGGRPLEFQCTLPVRPSRAHEVLFGATLRDHLIGEVIGPLLVKQCRTPISLLCCDQPEALAIGDSTPIPVALVIDAAEPEEGPIDEEALDGYQSTMLVGSRIMVPIEKLNQANEITALLQDLPDAVEPFERIREAIKEAQSQMSRAIAKAA